MAKLRMPLISGGASNKVGDVVFYRRGDWGINVARIRVIPKNPRTVNQVNVRHNIATLSKIWAGRIEVAGAKLYKYNGTTWTEITIASTETFGDTERQAWKEYVHTTRQGYRARGRHAFIGVNLQRLYTNQNPLKTPTTEFTLAT